MSRVAVLWSDASLRAKIAKALEEGACHPGVHLARPYQWLKGPWAYLGVNGARHWLWRLGIVHTLVDEQWLQSCSEDEIDALIIPEAEALEPRSIERLHAMADQGRCWVIILGATNLPESFLGAAQRTRHLPPRYLWAEDYPVSPPGYPVDVVRPLPTSTAFGEFAERDLGDGNGRHERSAPVGIRHGRVLWIPLRVCEYLGGLLQGHVDWWPLHQALGTDGLWYLDRLCQRLTRWLEAAGAGDVFSLRVPAWGSYAHAVVLRHDTDDSLDPTYWEMERRAQRPATYAVLMDRRAGRWVERLRRTPQIEVALHYRSNRDGFWERQRLRLTGRMPRADARAVTQDGLLRQVRQATSTLGAIRTIHRHYHHLSYPELFLALDTLYDAEPSILGSGSLSRFHLVRYGGAEEVKIPVPYAGIPFWFPIRAVIATTERHTTLRGWESAALIEPTPEQLQACVRHAEEFPGGSYTWVFHPAHTVRARFAPSGTLGWFRAAWEQLDRSWWATTASALYQRVERWSGLQIRKGHDGLELWNPAPEPLSDVVVRGPHGEFRVERLDANAAVRLPEACVSV